jgi:septal ring factor EnvC (AmiA/AmiB activator)
VSPLAAVRLADLRTEVAARDAALATTAMTYAENARRVEQAHAARVGKAQRARDDELAASRRTADALRADLDGLHGDIATFAACGPDDSRAACGERAAAVGQLLERALRAGARSSAAAEEHAADVRTLLAAWPVSPEAAP